MSSNRNRPRFLFLLLLAMAPGAAAATGVRDAAGLFSPQAVEQADAVAADVRKRFDKDVLVETLSEIPPEHRQRMAREGREAFFHRWARERAAAAQLNGVYLLVTREPIHVQVESGTETRRQAFTPANEKMLTEVVMTAFREKAFDAGLLNGIGYVQKTFEANLPPDTTRQSGGERGKGVLPALPFSGWSCLWWGAIGLLVVWVLGRVLRGGRTGQGRPYDYPTGAGPADPRYGPETYRRQGGGFGRGLLGGILGAAAGSWLYDHFLRGGQGGSTAWRGQDDADTSNSPEDGAGQDQWGETGDPGAGSDFGADSGGDFDGGGDGGAGGDF